MHKRAQTKWSNTLQPAAAAVVAIAVGCLAGCSSPGYKKGDAAAVSMASAAGEVEAESRALEATRQMLNDLVDNPAPDLKLQYRRYSDALDRLVSCAHRTEATGKTMARKSAAYFAAWDKQLTTIQYEVIRDGSIARKEEARKLFDTVNGRYQNTQAVVWPMISYLEDIRQALSTDLTRAGVSSVKPVAAHANENATKVQTAFAALSAALADARTRFSSFTATAQNTN
jgi:hypothetical protein